MLHFCCIAQINIAIDTDLLTRENQNKWLTFLLT